jgi:hypothetical protein
MKKTKMERRRRCRSWFASWQSSYLLLFVAEADWWPTPTTQQWSFVVAVRHDDRLLLRSLVVVAVADGNNNTGRLLLGWVVAVPRPARGEN